MRIIIDKIYIKSTGWEAIDLTDNVNELIIKRNIKQGLVTIYTPNKHSHIILSEYEPNLLNDLESFLKEFTSEKIIIDGLFGKSVVLPIINYELDIGIFKRIIFLDVSRESGDKEVVIVFEGETS